MKSIRMRLLLNLVLLGAVLALVWLAIYQPGKKLAPEPQRLTLMDPATITRIAILRPDQEAIRLVKENDRWWLKEPFPIEANENKIKSLFEFLEAQSQNSLDAKAHDLKRFGLAEPRVRLELNEAGFSFGDSHPLSGERYVLHEGRIYLIPDTTYHYLIAEAAVYASPHLVERGKQLIAIRLPDLNLRQKEAKWSLNPPDPELSADAIVRLVEEWKRSQALTVRRRQADTPTQGEVILEFQQPPPLRYEIVRTDPELVLVRPDLGIEYHLSADAAKRLLRPSSSNFGSGSTCGVNTFEVVTVDKQA
jgi:hypothetical protein